MKLDCLLKLVLPISLAFSVVSTQAAPPPTPRPADTMIGKAAAAAEGNNYWTPERMAKAKPGQPAASYDKVKEIEIKREGKSEGADGAPPNADAKPILDKPDAIFERVAKQIARAQGTTTFDRGTSNQQYTSSRLVPITADTTYPYRAVGKLFFTKPGVGDFVCSASVIRHRIVLTAGHCVHKGSGGTAGFYTNFLFIPAYRDGSAPFQSWRYTYVATNNTWATGGGGVPNAADYGMLEVEDKIVSNVSRKIYWLTGYLGYQTLSLIPNHAHLLGYPCNLDSCAKMHQVTAQSARSVAPNNVEYGSDMTGGSSGGPWVQNFGAIAVGQTGGLNAGSNRVIGVTSYVYLDTAVKSEGASIFDTRFTSLLNFICAHKTGNCTI